MQSLLVIEYPDWTNRTSTLFRELETTPALQARFLNEPSAFLDTYFGETPGNDRATISLENRLLFDVLRDPNSLASSLRLDSTAADASSGESGAYAAMLGEILRCSSRSLAQLALGTARNVGPAFDAGVDLRTQLATITEIDLRAQIDTQLAVDLRAQLDARLNAGVQAQLDAELRAQLAAALNVELHAQLDAELKLQLEARLNAELQAHLSAELRLQLEARLNAELNALIDAELRLQFETRLNAELHAHLDAELIAQLEAGLQVGAEGPGVAVARKFNVRQFSRHDLQKLAAFIASYCARVAPAHQIDTREDPAS